MISVHFVTRRLVLLYENSENVLWDLVYVSFVALGSIDPEFAVSFIALGPEEKSYGMTNLPTRF
jgi:hypothetical protein